MIQTISNPMMEVRTALTTTSNTTGGDARTGIGGVEINKKIDSMIVEFINKGVDLKPLIARKPLDQLSYIWNIRSDLGSTSKAAFYSDGATGTPYPSTKIQYFAPVKALRSDYEVTNLMIAGSVSYYNALEDEAQTAISELALAEEKAIICGTDTSA